ncbi:MAG: caspase family protein, partial [Lewinella sp.]|nr:caspase family protein [Lewinella sp.]
IGINAYPRSPLFGCVNDALDVYEFCRQLAEANESITEFRPKLLLAPHREDLSAIRQHHLGEDDYELPTRNNIIQAFSHFKQADADREDICLLYYSGHGSFQTAPQLFWNLKSGKQVESLVCMDSRTSGGRDLIDKELAYLLWDATHDKTSYEEGKPGIHTVLIYDCCHSGDNMRGESVVRNRMEVPNPNRTPITDYKGYRETVSRGNEVESEARFLKALEKWRSTRYVHLAAARDTETAKETLLDDRSSGVFTYSLLKTLRSGGMHLSYQELLERVKVMVQNRVDEQIPMLFATEQRDEQLTFMSRGLKAPVQEYVVSYNQREKVWKMNAGANAGIFVSTDENAKTLIQVWRPDQDAMEVEVKTVEAAECILDSSVFSGDDQQHEDWMGKVVQLPLVKQKLYITPEVQPNDRQELLTVKDRMNLPNFEFTDTREDAIYYVHNEQGEFILTKKNSNVPVFMRNPDPQKFLTAVQQVGQWSRVLEMNNEDTGIFRNAIKVEVEVIEGKPFHFGNFNTIEPRRRLTDPAAIDLSFSQMTQNGKILPIQPALRVRIKTTDAAYYVACLYLESKYGIISNLSSTEITPVGSGEWLKFRAQGKEFNTLPIGFDDKYHKLGITGITDYIKIFVSKKPFPVEGWAQDPLEMDDQLLTTKRSMTMMMVMENPSDWAAFTIPVHIKRPLEQQEQTIGGDGSVTANFGAMKVTVPSGFKGKISAVSTGQIKDLMRDAKAEVSRSVDPGEAKKREQKLNESLLPPSILWGSTPSSHAVFSRSVSAAEPDAQLSVLELTDTEGAEQISADNPLVLETDGKMEEAEVLISFGYDPETGLYLPLGISDADGKMMIDQLPAQTAGKIIGKESVNERSIKGSIKLFFKKVVIGKLTGQTNTNTLALCKLGNDGVSVATQAGDGVLADADIKSICLLIHGIIGDTEGQRQAFFETESELYKKFDAVLSYDYENLNTPIEETARLLKADLAKAGVTEAGGKRLTIIAHSMGGLVSRWFIEQEGGSAVVSRLIQCGTPNGGSETSDFRKSLFSMLGMAMNGAAFLKPYLPVLSFIGKKINKAVFLTLDQMSPTSSDFLKKLNVDGGPHPDVDYWVIGGNTNDIEPENLGDMPMLKQFWRAFKTRAPHALINKLVFKSDAPNDIAVTQVSMKTVPSQSSLPFHNVACDHLSYFEFAASMQKLQEIIEERV